MNFGLVLPNTGTLADPDSIEAIAKRAETLGFSALWTADHLVLPVDAATRSPYAKRLPDPDLAILDPLIVLTAAAAHTSSIRLGVSVYLAALRHPIVAAKLVASLDQISRGRVLLGVGAGWIPEEYETMGLAFESRGQILDEHIIALRSLFEQRRPFVASHNYKFSNMGFEPKPVQPRLPILIGGNSARARDRAARLGDGWHVIDVPSSELVDGVADLRRRCEGAGRDPASVPVSARAQIRVIGNGPTPRTQIAPLVGPLSVIRDELGRLHEAGVDHVGLWPQTQGVSRAGYLEQIEELAELFLERSV